MPALTSRRYLALWFPFLASDRLKRLSGGAPDERPLVIVEKQKGALRIVHADRRALSLGLGPGLALADARARVPALAVADDDPVADEALLARIAEACDRFTPLVARDDPHGLILDITGCVHLFGGEEGLLARMAERCAATGLSRRMAIAGTPEAARALSRHGPGGIVSAGGEEAAVRPLPIAALEAEAETLLALSRAGLKRIGDLIDRPSAALSSRFGEGLATRLRRLSGREDRRITPLRAPPACVVERHFAEPLMDLVTLEEVLERLLAEAGRVLERRGEGGRRFEIAIFRSDGAVRRIAVETGRPIRDAATVLRLYRERVEVLADPLDPGFGFDAVRLAVPVCERFDDAQPSLDRRTVEEEAVGALVDRLVARFGRERVLHFVARDSHDPRRAAAHAPATDAAVQPVITWPAPLSEEPPLRPLQVFEPPQPIETLAEVPDGPPLRFRWRRILHEIARAEGPERISPEWWRDGPQPALRDYYRVEDARGHRFWVFRSGLYGQGAEQPRWYLHGLFA